MTFSATKDKQTLIKFSMVRMTPARSMSPYLTAIGGAVYRCPWTIPVARVERVGRALTKDTAIPTGFDHWWFDEANQLFYVKSNAPPNGDTNIVCLFYYLFATSGMAVLASEDPTNTALPVRPWEPRITSEPRVSQSVQNVIAGIFSIADTSLTLANADNWFNQWLSLDDSWNEKDVDIWQGIKASEADTPDYQAIYRGKVKNLTLDRSNLTLTVLDAFSRLNQPALMGDAALEAYFRTDSGSYPNCDPTRVGEAVPFYFGSYSWHGTKTLGYPWNSGPSGYLEFDSNLTPRAVCTSYSSTVAVTNNRTWTLGRVSPDGLRSWGSGLSGLTLTAIAFPQQNLVQLTYGGGGVLALDISIGDTVKLSQTALATHYGRVGAIADTYIYLITDMTVFVAYTTSVTVTPQSDPGIMIEDSQTGAIFFPVCTTDYTTSVSTTTGGNKLVSIVFNNNFESRLIPQWDDISTTNYLSTLDPSRHNVYFRLTPALTNYANHADILNYICSVSGLTPNTSTFSAAKSALAVNGFFSIPYLDETDYRLYVDYVQDILSSTMGIISLDSSSQVEYSLIQIPSSADATDDNVILRGASSDLAITVEYQDIVTQLIAYNPHNNTARALAATPSPSETRNNVRAVYLHGINNSILFRHVLETITGRIDQIMAAKSNRRATYTFGVANKFLDAQIGQDTVVGGDCLLGADTSRAVKIFSLDRSSDVCTVSAVDLQGIS